MATVYITNVAKFLPNNPVNNDDMEMYLGRIRGLKSKSKALVLRSNGIKTRYYAMDKDGNYTHSNAELAAHAIRNLKTDNFDMDDIELLCCGSASPDLMMPSLACMVHGELGINPIDAMSASGSCNSSMWAFNYAWMSILTGKVNNAVCSGSETLSFTMVSEMFEEESKYLEALNENPYVAFEKEFLRWMLSDGAAAVLMQNKPNEGKLSFRIDWIEIKSYANELETCMYYGGIKDENQNIKSWRRMSPKAWGEHSAFALKQDSKILQQNITRYGGMFLKELIEKKSIDTSRLNYFLPHISSEFFRSKIKESMQELGIEIDDDIWFTNLTKVGNVATASAFLMLDELYHSDKLKKGDTLLVMVPESARFSYTYVHLTVV